MCLKAVFDEYPIEPIIFSSTLFDFLYWGRIALNAVPLFDNSTDLVSSCEYFLRDILGKLRPVMLFVA